MDSPIITAEAIRANLLVRATAFAKEHRTSFSAMSREAVKDDRFLARAQAGANFTIETYQRFIDWMDTRDAAATEPERGAA